MGKSMIVEERIYTLQPGRVPEMVRLYGEEGLAMQQQYLGTFLGYFTSESGDLNQVVFMWGYEGVDDRARRRAEMMRDPKWQEFSAKVLPLIIRQENRFLKPTSFSPIR